MLTEPELLALMAELESFRVERTISTTDSDKFREAICSFANDMPNSGLAGYLLIGVDDKTGRANGIKVSDQLLQNLVSYRSDGMILPPPALVAYKFTLSSGEDVAVVEVQPSHTPPVRYKGRVCVRSGPRRGIANEAEERILTERRIAAAKPFDMQPCIGATLDDLAMDIFLGTYRVAAIARDVLDENHRPVEQQMASLRLFDLARNCPTQAAMLLFAKDPLQWLPHAYIQYVHFPGTEMADQPLTDKRFNGDLLTMLRELESFVRGLPTAHPVEVSALREEMVYDFPATAIRELIMNAVSHRSYEAASPIRFYRFSDRLEIISPGPLYGEATPANFPRQTSYRNPVIAEALAVLGFVNQYGRGVLRAQAALKANGSPEAQFEFGDTFFGVKVPARS
jgi:ATP-dependent DNA helicase RecG